MKNIAKKIIASIVVISLIFSMQGIAMSYLGTDNACEKKLTSTEYPDSSLSEEEVPEILDIASVKANGSVRRLYVLEDDVYSAVFENEDGSKTLYSFSYPIKYVDGNGNMKDKSNEIIPFEGNSYSYYTPYNDIQTFFPEKLSEKDMISIVSGNYTVAFGPEYCEGTSSGKAERDGKNGIVYEDVFENGYSLSYQPQFWGLKEEIIIQEDSGKYDFGFYLNTNGLIPYVVNNCVYLKDETGTVIGELSDVTLYDSADIPNHSENNSVSLAPTDVDGIYIYEISIDKSYMQDSDTVYPVYVDPSVTINSSGSGTSKTIMDTPVYSSVPSSCQGSNQYNVIGNANAMSSGYGIGRTLMKFPGLINNTIFQGVAQSQVSSMNLYLYSSSGSVSSSTVYINLYTGSAWNETSTTYNNVSWSGYGTQLASGTVSSGNQWVSFNIKSAITTWQNSSTTADKGVMIRNSNESSTSYAKAFCSTESSYKPYITLTWSAAAPSGITEGNIYQIKNKNTSQYASASVASSINQVATPGTQRSYELWRFEKVMTGVYRIESLGVRSETYGLSRMMLTANAASTSATSGTLSLTSYSTGTSTQWWYVNKTDQGYSFVNYYYPLLAVSVPSNTGNLTLSNSSGNSKWSLVSKTYSDYYSGGYSGGSAPYVINVIIDSSAITTYLTNDVYSCVTAWNNIDSNISINYYPATYTGTYASADFTVTVKGENLRDLTLGRMIPTPSNINGNWTSAIIKINTFTGSGGINNANAILYDKQMNFLHEMGHALKLKHPEDNNAGWFPLSIMNQGLPSIANYYYITCRPSGYDKYNLSRKW